MRELLEIEVQEVDGAVLPLVVAVGIAFGKGFVAGVGVASAGYVGYKFYEIAVN
ncbi:hypothetical protein [Stenotrophomonas acidaminiphila]|uniref:hypothetical protein n=1 Tax=Stenotrophomonas acidaminiphila TaxID=128780 RepID=UPI0024ACD785|nr:hypothetical protein [Stenotrophomonas acidaminiphila]WHL18516.1 hypothetical protein QLF99_15920 [Stenotrophomonas acidaminiphila]